MEAIIFFSVLLSMGISLGVGSSTIAILNFFTAIRDGKIEDDERKFLGVTYIVLRVAMIVILLSIVVLACIGFSTLGTNYFSSYIIAQFILIGVLYLNAILMTLRIMPSKFGPAIQASSWYALGFTLALESQGIVGYSILEFLLGYISLFVFAVILINFVMNYFRKIQNNTV